MEQLELTEIEKRELRLEIPKIQTLLEESSNQRNEFLKNPFVFLRAKTKISLLNFLAESKELIEDFDEAVRKLFNRLRKFFNKCVACKLAALIIIYALLAKFGIPLFALVDYLGQFIAKLQDFFENKSESADSLLTRIARDLDKIKPKTLALRFCEAIGMCQPKLVPELIPIPIQIPPSGVPA